MSDTPISYQPTDGLSYDPEEAVYWQPAALAKEIERTFEICHGCRLCFKFCDTFPSLFDLIDRRHDGDVRRLTAAETEAVLDTCFQCKLCDINCPYTERDQHPYRLDFPKLVHRQRAIRARAKGLPVRDRVLGDPDRAGTLARASFGLANTANRTRVHRWFLEKVLGVHRDKLLPEFAAESFEGWARRTGRLASEPGGEVVLFPTCYVEHNDPGIGRDTVEVLERSRVDVRCARGLACCGMPAWERGDLSTLRTRARQNLDVLAPFVERGARVVAINPTCAMMLRREYPTLVAAGDRERAQRLAAVTMDPSEFLWSIRDEPRFAAAFASTPGGPVAYHAPCHLRAQAIGFKGRDLLRRILGVQLKMVIECCGHDGTYAMTVEGFEASQRVGQRSFDGMRDAKAEVWVTDCPLAALQFAQHAGVKPMHPMSVLARAYRPDGFPTAPRTPETTEERQP